MNLLRVFLPLAILAGCASEAPTPPDLSAGEVVTQQALLIYRRNEEVLRLLLSDTSHRLPPKSGLETRYFGEKGEALFLLPNEDRAVSGEWKILPSRSLGYYICASRGRLPGPEVGKEMFRHCMSVEELIEASQRIVKGDVSGLKQKAE